MIDCANFSTNSLLSPWSLSIHHHHLRVRGLCVSKSRAGTSSGSYLNPGTQTSSTVASTLSPTQTISSTRTLTRTIDTCSYTTSRLTSATGTSIISALRRPQTAPRSHHRLPSLPLSPTGMISSPASSDHDSNILHAHERFLNHPCWKMKAMFIDC